MNCTYAEAFVLGTKIIMIYSSVFFHLLDCFTLLLHGQVVIILYISMAQKQFEIWTKPQQQNYQLLFCLVF